MRGRGCASRTSRKECGGSEDCLWSYNFGWWSGTCSATEKRWKELASRLEDAPSPLTVEWVQGLAAVPFDVHLANLVSETHATSTGSKEQQAEAEAVFLRNVRRNRPDVNALYFLGLYWARSLGALDELTAANMLVLAGGEDSFARRKMAIRAALNGGS